MTLTRESEALAKDLSSIQAGWSLAEARDTLAAIEATVRAEQAAEVERLGALAQGWWQANAVLLDEVERLREALAMTTDALDVWVQGSHRVVDGRCPHRDDGPCTSHRVVAEARAALAATAPEPAP